MKKRKVVLNILVPLVIALAFSLVLTACENTNSESKITGSESKNTSDYKSLRGYKEYISDSDKGYEDMPYFNVIDSMEESFEAREYYRANSRECGDYIITDYEDGVCINKFIGQAAYSVNGCTIDIPATLDGKPVVKIGCYPEYEGFGFEGREDISSPFGGLRDCTLNLPETVKVISAQSIWYVSGIMSEDDQDDLVHLVKINADEVNPYYSSEDGVLYSKDKKKLLFVYFDYGWQSYSVPDFVESFEPSLGVPYGFKSIEIGKNVNNINAGIDIGEGNTPEFTVYGYKGTAAEEWARQEDLEFEALD